MLQQLKSEIANIKPSSSDLRKFGIILSGLVFVWAVFFASGLLAVSIGLITALLTVSIFLPEILKLIYLPLMLFAVIVGFFLFRAFLTVVFFVVLTPIRLFAFGAKKHKFPDPTAKSYWKKVGENG